MSSVTKDTYVEGYDAYWVGTELSDNPYPRDSDEASVWHDGWLQGREEDCEREEKE